MWLRACGILNFDEIATIFCVIRSRGVTWGSGELLEAVKPEGRQQVCHDVHPDLQV